MCTADHHQPPTDHQAAPLHRLFWASSGLVSASFFIAFLKSASLALLFDIPGPRGVYSISTFEFGATASSFFTIKRHGAEVHKPVISVYRAYSVLVGNIWKPLLIPGFGVISIK